MTDITTQLQKIKNNYHKDTLKITIDMAWPAIVESFFVAFAGLIDSLMVSSLGSSSVAAVGLTTQPKLLGLALFFALNVAISALVARRRGEQRQDSANEILYTAVVYYRSCCHSEHRLRCLCQPDYELLRIDRRYP